MKENVKVANRNIHGFCFENLQFISTPFIINFQEIPPTPRLFGTPALLHKEYSNSKLNILMVIEAMII